MHQEREIRQESYLATKYEKARQDVGLFLLLFKNTLKENSYIVLFTTYL
jgi:hypothetical protein